MIIRRVTFIHNKRHEPLENEDKKGKVRNKYNKGSISKLFTYRTPIIPVCDLWSVIFTSSLMFCFFVCLFFQILENLERKISLPLLCNCYINNVILRYFTIHVMFFLVLSFILPFVHVKFYLTDRFWKSSSNVNSSLDLVSPHTLMDLISPDSSLLLDCFRDFPSPS